MAGGRGSRLAPLTTVLPKPLMPLTDRPVIDVILRQLAHAGVDRVTISVGYLGSLIEAWVNEHARYGIPVDFVYEDEPLGTAGSLKLIDDFDGTFLALNGDILTTLDFNDLLMAQQDSDAAVTMAVKERTVSVEYGVVHADDAGNVVSLEEKPQIGYLVSMGVYAFDPSIVALIRQGERVDFPDLLERATSGGSVVATFPFSGYWRDIGNRDDYEAAIAEFGENPKLFIGG